MRRNIRMTSLLTLALLTACGCGPVAAPAVPTATVSRPAVASTPMAPTPSAPPRSTLPIAEATDIPTPTVAPTSTAIPTPTPTVPPATATAEPEPTDTPSIPTPTIDVAQLIARGQRLVERNNCLGCHSIDGQTSSAPTLKALFGAVRQLDRGPTVIADVEYLRESIKDPAAKVVDGYFAGAMPKVFFNDEELAAMVEYIMTLE